MSRRSLRSLPSVLLLGWGAALLARPERVGAAVAGRPTPPSWLVRVLGARQLIQEIVVLAAPTPAVARTAAAVELLHGLSMLAGAVAVPRYRRAQLVSAGVAAAAAVLPRAGGPGPRA